ncbi:NAD-dependent epimerase/dehydratase [Shewanella baltica OS223]|uniref:UDP-glucose 4-epimerase family protein n=1 Tax=Shewanella baltica TaxID=62322 RepID=UPI000153105B|nr:SDR family oxidoreductase [Shewanella baltica]ACK45991.1 NAD-dependent epimerase/dehydratase [Shewanella baltica OS223]
MNNVLITGATGFVGSVLTAELKKCSNVKVISVVRKLSTFIDDDTIVVGDIDGSTDYSAAINGVDIVIHCAARAHIMRDESTEPLVEYRKVNLEATLNLAKQAIKAGVKRFVFVSSIKVNGERSPLGKPFKHGDISNPLDDYGVSKSEAELQLIELSNATGLEVVVIRPTLVYGPGVKANFGALMNLVAKGIPLPFGYINQNKRSLVSVVNLVDLIITCIDHPKAANQVFLVSDDYDVSTSEMVREMAKALEKPSWQLPIPIWCYKLAGKLFKKSDVVDRLTGSLQVDIFHTKETLGWKPPQTLQDGFKQTAQAFLQAKTK